MSSLKLSISFENYDSKKPTFSIDLPLPNTCSRFSISNQFHLTKTCTVTSFNRFSPIRISPIQLQTTQYPIDKTSIASKSRTKREVGFKFTYRRNGNERHKDSVFVVCDSELDVNYSAISSGLSLKQCNRILKHLETRSTDDKTSKFFDWMRSNGKLQMNADAYNVILRVLGRQKNWNSAERMILEVRNDFGSELDSRLFNTLIYACYKQHNVELGAKWFRMMLELQVKPNIATFGMLMGLYQKGWNVEEAEFVFAQMRSLGIVCQSAYSAMITIYTRLSLYDKAEEVIGLMSKDKVPLNIENWLVSLNAYSQQGKLEKAEQVFMHMKKAGVTPNIVAYNTLITGYGKISNMPAAQRLFLDIWDVGLKPDETTYRSMIEGWGRLGNYKKADWFYKELKRMGFKPYSSNLYTLLNLQAKHGDEQGASRTLDDMVRIGCQYSSILGTLLKAYERAGRMNKVPVLLKGSFYQYILINQTACSILVMAYVKHCLIDDAIKVLGDKEWNDPVFEDNLYHLLICTCKELGHLDNAIKIYNGMPKSDDKPNLHISCTMMDIYGLMGQFNEGRKLYLKLKSCQIALDMIAYSIIVRMFVKSGSLKDACSVLETMEKQKDIVPDIYLFRDMLRIYRQCGLVNKLRDLYYRIMRSGVVWDQELYNCVINCCARALPVDELSRLFEGMIQLGFVPTTITCNVMLDVYGKSKLLKKARDLFLWARKLGLIDVISYNTIIAGYGRDKDLQNMTSAVRTMQFDGFSVSLEAYNCMLDAYGKEGQMANFRSILQRMKESSCVSDHYTYNIMINIYGEQGWIDEVAAVLAELRDCGPGPDLCSYNTLIKAYGIAGMVEDAVDLIKEMRENGVEPDKITYTNLVSALQRNDKYLEAVKWSLWMKQVGL